MSPNARKPRYHIQSFSQIFEIKQIISLSKTFCDEPKILLACANLLNDFLLHLEPFATALALHMTKRMKGGGINIYFL